MARRSISSWWPALAALALLALIVVEGHIPSRVATAGIAVGVGGEEVASGDTLTPLTPEQLRAAELRDAQPHQEDAGAAALRKSLGHTAEEVAALPPLVLPEPAALTPLNATAEEQRVLLRRSAKTAWTFVANHLSRRGYVGATDFYPYVTVWDMASSLAAVHSARELGLITAGEYHARVDTALRTLQNMRLYDSVAFNKMYSTQTGEMVDRATHPSTVGYGWSAVDHGRLLVWLKIIGADPSFSARTDSIVRRLDLKRLVVDGYLRGQDLNPAYGRSRRRIAKDRIYGEGRIGYEQYAAEGFALWGTRADLALNFAANAKPVVVEGQTVLADTRGHDLLTSEPFVMMGLELGWHTPHWRTLSLAVLAAQEARWRQTGRLSMLSEDAIPHPPTYFYYYLLYRDGSSFIVTTPLGATNERYPRWASTKAAFGYFALAPSDYTWRAVQAVQPSGVSGAGWTAGVYEATGRATKQFNLNTAAVVLESAAYVQRGGCPFIQQSCTSKKP
jgi:Protein of unknown function (DUF3131).